MVSCHLCGNSGEHLAVAGWRGAIRVDDVLTHFHLICLPSDYHILSLGIYRCGQGISAVVTFKAATLPSWSHGAVWNAKLASNAETRLATTYYVTNAIEPGTEDAWILP